MTMSCAELTMFLKVSRDSGFFFFIPRAAIPTNAEKITTAIVDVFLAPVISRNGFVGMKSRTF